MIISADKFLVMKKFFSLIILLFCTIFISAQKDSVGVAGEPIAKSKSTPEFPGGHQAFSMQIFNNFQSHQLVRSNIERAKAVATFFIEPDGSMSDIKIESYENELVKNEFLKAIRRVKTKWIPAEKNGEKVRMKMKQPLIFQLK